MHRGVKVGDGKFRQIIISSSVLDPNLLPGPLETVQFGDTVLKVIAKNTEWVR